jgi:glycosyltransferase involved in cell wall biosynthesis
MTKVSIIVPVYNIEKYIDKCLDSLVHQTLDDIQIIIVNDGSTDNSGKIIERYKERYYNKIAYLEKTNGGLSDARNTGLKYARGEYIGCIDGDDYADLTMFEKLYYTAKENDACFVECDYYHVYPNRLKVKKGELYRPEEMLVKARCGAWNKIIKLELIKKIGVWYPLGLQYEDMEFFCKITPYIKKIGFVKEPLYYYVQRQNSICHSYTERTADIFTVFDNILEYYKKNGLYERYEYQLEYICTRTLLSSSFFRMIRIHDKNLRNKLLRDNWKKLIDIFPNWRKNSILCKRRSLLDMFLKTQNRFTYTVYSKFFSVALDCFGR